MKAVVLTEGGLALREVPAPEPKPNEVLVKVAASGLNRADLIMAAGRPHGALGGAGAIAGLEWAGEIAAVGADVPEFRPGDQVMCSGAGGYAEFAVTDWGRVCPIPKALAGPVEAATLPIALQTMHDALVTNGRLAAGESVLIQGARLGCRDHGDTDRPPEGRRHGDRHLPRCRPTRPPRRVRCRSRPGSRRFRLGGEGARRHWRQGRRPHHRSGLGRARQSDDAGGSGAGAHRQRGPPRRLHRRVRLRSACAEAQSTISA